METLQEQPLPSQSSILYSQAMLQRKSRSEWSRKKHNTLALSPSETLFFLFLVYHLKVFYTHFILRELLLRTISQRGPKSEISFEKFIHVGVDIPPRLQKRMDAIYLCKPKRKGREDKKERSNPAEGGASNTSGRAEQHPHRWDFMDWWGSSCSLLMSANLKAAFRGSLSYILPLLLLAKLLSIFSLWHTALTQPVHLPCITPCSVLIPSLQTPTLQRCSFHHPCSVSQASKSLQVGFNSSQ